ncbi:hypothetical protein [uncultured Shewanella sp.]|uniref:hypothetical protein n=1 Tax=uncultured Shewanella sp. TaxID=173975 RepID=UPI00261D4866|nr:hypothetical protein [uncultured Shewanella sp.]
MRRFILSLRALITVLITALGCALLLQGCASVAVVNDDHDDVIPAHRQNQTDLQDEVQKVSVIFPIGQQYEQHKDECWGNDTW